MNSGKRLKKDNLYDDRLPEIRWRFPHQRARWFGMTVLFGARTYLCKFQFVYLLSKADKHNSLFISPAPPPCGTHKCIPYDMDRNRVGQAWNDNTHNAHDLAPGLARHIII